MGPRQQGSCKRVNESSLAFTTSDAEFLRSQYGAFNTALRSLYNDDILQLADKEKPFEFDDSLFEAAASLVYENGGFDISQLEDPAARAVINETLRVLSTAIDSGLPHEVPTTVRYTLENNAFIFSGFKTFHSMREIGLSMVTDKGEIKPFNDFMTDVKKINQKYNHNYLYAEYNHAVGTSLMAAKWHDFEQDGDRYDLQYRTANDGRVREEHALLHETTLPASDPFWDKYFPPNGWNCRCTVVQVRKGKYPTSDPAMAMLRGDNCTDGVKQRMFRYNPGKTMELFPPKHPYRKAPKAAKAVIEKVSAEEMRAKRIQDIIAELPDTLTQSEKQAIAENCLEIEQALGIIKGKPMSVEEADKQNANPNYVPEYIIDPNGRYTDRHNRLSINPNYNKKRDYPYSVNCQTCAPAYALRLLGFNVTAKPKTPGSKLEYLSMGRGFEVWNNLDGTPAQHTSINSWLSAKKYQKMTPKRYMEFFNEVCKEPGVYELVIGWKYRGGHATILQRFNDGTLRYIEPQADNSAGSGYEWKDVNYLANAGASTSHNCRGIMRIDNKLFNLNFIEIFDK